VQRNYSIRLHAPAGPGRFPPEDRVGVLTLASSKTQDHHSPDSHWSLDELAFRLVNEVAQKQMSRAPIWRILDADDRKPHQSVYWLNSHDKDFDQKAKAICRLYVNAPRLYQQGRLVICSDEKTGMQILQRKYPTRPARETRVRVRPPRYPLPVGDVQRGDGGGGLGSGPDTDGGGLGGPPAARPGAVPRPAGVRLGGGQPEHPLVPEVCRVVAGWEGITLDERPLAPGQQRKAFLSDPRHDHVFHFTPLHGSWLNQVELFFSVLRRKLLKRGDFASAAAFEERVRARLERDNREQAHPYRWTYTGEPLVRTTPFSQTDRQRRQGRAWFGTRPPLFDRLIHPLVRTTVANSHWRRTYETII
jgi:hypothetical protein